MSKEETTKKADQAVEMFRKVSWEQPTSDGMETWNLDRHQSTQCAIIMYEDKFNESAKDLLYVSESEKSIWAYFQSKHLKNQAILTELKSRL